MHAQGRVILVARMFREGMVLLARAGKPTPAMKERLLALVEEEAWALPSDVFDGAPADEWELRALADPRVVGAIERAVGGARSVAGGE